MTLTEKIKLFNGTGSWTTYTANGKIPQIFMSDGPHGLRKQDFENYADLNHSNIATCFPTGSCIASSWNKESLRELGRSIAKEALAEKVQLVLGPGINIKRSPLCGRNFEYYSEDPYLAGTLAANYIEGMQSSGVGTCVKHFACNNQEKRRQTSSSNIDEKTLHKIYLRPFEIAVKKSAPVSIMCSYNKVNGTYVSHNDYLLNKILRKKWGFSGAVISDWGACIDAVKCIKAGLDLAMPNSSGYFENQLKKGLQTGTLAETELDAANDRLISLAQKLSDMQNAALSQTPDNIVYVDYARQYRTAINLAEDSAVLLKNDGFLPLKEKANLVIVGELAEKMKFQGGGSSHITTSEHPNAIQALSDEGFSVTYVSGYYSGFCKSSKVSQKNEPLLQKALEVVRQEVAKNPDVPVLFFCGLTDAFEGEGFDRTSLLLPQEQLVLLSELLQITQNLGIVSFSGAPIDLTPAQNARAILHMYLCGEGSGQAVADLLSGNVNPSGKLAETWPLKIEDTPCYGNFANESNEVDYVEGELVGYRWYNAKNIPVQFPFGFGLSYTTFKTELLEKEITITPEYEKGDGPLFHKFVKNGDGPLIPTISVGVTNLGKVAGAEVVQIYCGLQGKPKVLCGFEKVYLHPGETKIIQVELDDYAFYDYDLDCHDFKIKYGVYEFATNVNFENIDNPQTLQKTTKSTLLQNNDNEPQVRNHFYNEQLSNKGLTATSDKSAYTITNSLEELAENSARVRTLLRIIIFALKCMHKGVSSEDPSVKIEIAAIKENPLESLISTSGGIITERFAKKIVKWANGSRR